MRAGPLRRALLEAVEELNTQASRPLVELCRLALRERNKRCQIGAARGDSKLRRMPPMTTEVLAGVIVIVGYFLCDGRRRSSADAFGRCSHSHHSHRYACEDARLVRVATVPPLLESGRLHARLLLI